MECEFKTPRNTDKLYYTYCQLYLAVHINCLTANIRPRELVSILKSAKIRPRENKTLYTTLKNYFYVLNFFCIRFNVHFNTYFRSY